MRKENKNTSHKKSLSSKEDRLLSLSEARKHSKKLIPAFAKKKD